MNRRAFLTLGFALTVAPIAQAQQVKPKYTVRKAYDALQRVAKQLFQAGFSKESDIVAAVSFKLIEGKSAVDFVKEKV